MWEKRKTSCPPETVLVNKYIHAEFFKGHLQLNLVQKVVHNDSSIQCIFIFKSVVLSTDIESLCYAGMNLLENQMSTTLSY